MALYPIWQSKFPQHIVIGQEGLYYTAHGKSALILAEVLDRKLNYSAKGKVSTSTTNIQMLLSGLDKQSLSYVVYKGETEILYKSDAKNPFEEFPNINELGLSTSFNNILQAINALEDGINPTTGEFYEDDAFVLTDMAKEILSLARKGLFLYSQNFGPFNNEHTVPKQNHIEVVGSQSSIESECLEADIKEELGAFAQYKQKLLEKGIVRAYEPWQETEDQELISEFTNGCAITKIATIHKRTPGAITSRLKKLNLIDENNSSPDTVTPAAFIDTNIEPEIIKTILRAEDCHTYRKGDCSGIRCTPEECPDFIPAVNLSKEEVALWPKYGDASALRIGDKSRFND